MSFAEGMPATNQRRGIAVVHTHTGERQTDGIDGILRVVTPHKTTWVDVDELHLYGGPVFVCGAVAVLRARVQMRLPVRIGEGIGPRPGWFVNAGGAESDGGPAHGLDAGVAREDDQVAPAQPETVLLLDGPGEVASLVQVRVVHPASFGVEALACAVAAAAAIDAPVGAGIVPPVRTKRIHNYF